jgi:hypothetical protein
MNSFILPLSGVDDGSSGTKYRMIGSDRDRVFSPYNGTIINVSKTDDYGNITIEHDFNEEKLISKIENVYNPISGFGTLRRGGTIGFVKDKPIIFTVTDDNGKKINIKTLLSGESLSKKPDKKTEKKPKQEYKRKNTKYEELPALARLFGDIAKLPDSLVKKGISSLKDTLKEDVESNTLLIEQSERIKDLMKKIDK